MSRSCLCLVLSRAAWCTPTQELMVRDAAFNVIDDFNHQRVHIEVDTSINSARLVRIFKQIKRDHGLPKAIRTDNGPEFLGEASKQ